MSNLIASDEVIYPHCLVCVVAQLDEGGGSGDQQGGHVLESHHGRPGDGGGGDTHEDGAVAGGGADSTEGLDEAQYARQSIQPVNGSDTKTIM